MKLTELRMELDALIRGDTTRTFEDVAKLAGVSPITLRHFLHKGRNIRVDRLQRILAVYRRELGIVEAT